jgi:hypothetical protein
MAANVEKWLERAKTFHGHVGMLNAPTRSGEALAFAISMASTFYGESSAQAEALKRSADNMSKSKEERASMVLYEFASGYIANMAAELNSGLVENLRLRLTGEILSDLVGMAREALTENAVHVAAVLTAAAFEDAMRRLAEEKAGITERIKLEQVVIALKEKGVLQGGEPGVVQSFLKFRNDSLHADWNNVTESQVTSCLGLLDTLIVKHFS